MKTGFDQVDVENSQTTEFKDKVQSILMVLLEKAIGSAAMYMKAAGRNTLTAMDMKYGMMYEAHEFFSRDDLEEKFAEFYEASSEDEDSDGEDGPTEVDEDDEPFTKATSDDPVIVKMNRYCDEWKSWHPTDPIQLALKNTIDAM